MSTNSSVTVAASAAVTSRSLRTLYFVRAAFSIVWVVLVALLIRHGGGIITFLLIIYPAWDLAATLFDIKRVTGFQTPLLVNAGISAVATIAVGIALQSGVPETLIAFGVWAILTGIIQLVLGLRRRKSLNGQWPMIISGGQSVLGGTSFILLAHDPTKGIANLAGYAAFGAFYYLLAAFRLSKMVNA